MAEAAAVKTINFVWEGTDKKGNRIKGKTVAVNEAAVKADLRRQGIAPVKISKARPPRPRKAIESAISRSSAARWPP